MNKVVPFCRSGVQCELSSSLQVEFYSFEPMGHFRLFQDDERTRKPTTAEKAQKKKLKNRARFKKWKKRSEENRRILMEKGLMMEELELELKEMRERKKRRKQRREQGKRRRK